jgi:cytoplasmic iron level regulating protein YaaA (DUF328/UPF0246 family)
MSDMPKLSAHEQKLIDLLSQYSEDEFYTLMIQAIEKDELNDESFAQRPEKVIPNAQAVYDELLQRNRKRAPRGTQSSD